MADAINGNKKLWNLASRCVVKNYNDVKRIADLNGDFGNHVVDTSNPHSVNKSQVGLGNVQNVDTTNPANITQSSSYRFVTDTEKNTWNNKQDAISGYTGTLTVVTATVPSVLTKTITITNGIITDIS